MAEEATAETATQGYGAATGTNFPTTGAHSHATSEAHQLWQLQATKVREAALRLLLNRFASDIEAARELFAATKPAALELQVEYARKLTINYLMESEKLFKLVGNLIRPTPDSRIE
jgi:hypothetical protein